MDVRHIICSIFIYALLCCSSFAAWNNPYPHEHANKNYYYTSFSASPKTLDPARSYSSDEWAFIAQIYEPPLQYHYLLRPYKLVPLTLKKMPEQRFFDKNGHPLAADVNVKKIAYTQYDLYLKPNIRYQPHPAFARDKTGGYRYHQLSLDDLENVTDLSDFEQVADRELVAADYVYQIKRLADPKLHSPIYSLLSKYIVGFSTLHDDLKRLYKNKQKFDLRDVLLRGVRAMGPYHYRILIKGYYPQFVYWLAMPFFAPMPWEANNFYSQMGLQDKNINLAWHPVGTGPYMLVENNPNRQMILAKNPNFHPEYYPTKGEASDGAKGYLADAGQRLPFIDKVIFSLEKESIPRWSKFMQGYYDRSGISNDNFARAIIIDKEGKPQLTPELKAKEIKLQSSVELSTFYIGFNMFDDVVGGNSEKSRLLRIAISIAVDYEEYLQLFQNGRGIVAHSPLPPGIWGYQEGKAGMNPYVYQWQDGKAKRRSIDYAKTLMAKAGYANGIDPKTKQPLQLYFDISGGNSPDNKALYAWLRKEFSKLGIELHIRATQYNRFQEKIRSGKAQIFFLGWHADYPDPENFLFLLYGMNSKLRFGGENAANYINPRYDRLFEKMHNMTNSPEREAIVKKMTGILQHDAPWIWGMHPKQFVLLHHWSRPTKHHAVANNTIKYLRTQPKHRSQHRIEWNKPVTWPLIIIVLVFALLLLPAIISFLLHQHRSNRKNHD